ncbi:MAG: uncharacterized protein KVP18_004921 [Porospora cf. gigantea A]|uniref:uncharacterized protein n=1 Tax=Porospora cf. gigantea A TaxID=2853593 RepID=UPI00355A5CAC|nr:MAG: hypothetical protein KVP18_004921 [Porospora cf. gigantea A]
MRVSYRGCADRWTYGLLSSLQIFKCADQRDVDGEALRRTRNHGRRLEVADIIDFWSGIYRIVDAQDSSLFRLPSKFMDIYKSDERRGGSMLEMSYLFAALCGLGPMLELDLETSSLRLRDAPVRFTNKWGI